MGSVKNDFMVVLKIHGLENQEFFIIEREHNTLKKIAKSKWGEITHKRDLPNCTDRLNHMARTSLISDATTRF